MVSNEYSINDRVDLDKPTSDDQQSKPPVKFDSDNDDINDNMFSIVSTINAAGNRMYSYLHFGLER